MGIILLYLEVSEDKFINILLKTIVCLHSQKPYCNISVENMNQIIISNRKSHLPYMSKAHLYRIKSLHVSHNNKTTHIHFWDFPILCAKIFRF